MAVKKASLYKIEEETESTNIKKMLELCTKIAQKCEVPFENPQS